VSERGALGEVRREGGGIEEGETRREDAAVGFGEEDGHATSEWRELVTV
jgi:hypothetical protein